MSCRPLRGMRVAPTLREMLAGPAQNPAQDVRTHSATRRVGRTEYGTVPRGATRRSRLDCAGPAANHSGLKSDRTPTRDQRGEVTRSEANGIACGAGRFAGGLRREGCASRPCKGAGSWRASSGSGTCESTSSGVRSRRRPTASEAPRPGRGRSPPPRRGNGRSTSARQRYALGLDVARVGRAGERRDALLDPAMVDEVVELAYQGVLLRARRGPLSAKI